jgi:hypothetical protein
MECPGSIPLNKAMPEEQATRYADEGSAAHSLGEYFLKHKIYKPDLDKDWSFALPEKYRKYYSQEMVEHVRVYTEYVLKQIEGKICLVAIEQTLNLDWLYPGIWGTCDVYVVQFNGVLKVTDFKYGMGIPVSVYDNTQLKIYGLMAGKQLTVKIPKEQIMITLAIVQPRVEGGIETWTVSYMELLKWAKAELLPAIRLSEGKNPPLKCGDWCRFCHASGICPEKKKEIITATKAQFQGEAIVLPAIETLTVDEAAKVFALKQAIEKWGASAAAYLRDKLKKGEKSEVVKLVRGKPNRVWTNEDQVKEKIGLFVDVFTKPKLKSPAQVEKLVKKQAPDLLKTMESLIDKPEPGLVVALRSDKRAEVNVNSIADDFLEELDVFK